MSLALNKMKSQATTVKVKFSGTNNAPFTLLKEEIGAFLISKGYAVVDCDETAYSDTIRVSAGKE